MALEITLFTDPACPFAFSAEPARLKLTWHYGDGLEWTPRMIVLTAEPGEAEKLAEGAPGLQQRYGMPIDPAPLSRPASSEPACRAVVATRLNDRHRTEPFIRRLRVRAMLGGLLDDPALLAVTAADAGIDPDALAAWSTTEAVQAALEADMAAARTPSRAARALDHKLSGPAGERRYSAPSYEIRRPSDGFVISVPGFNPVEAYEVAIASLAPELERRPSPESVGELLAWAPYPLATAEVAAIGQLDPRVARAQLNRVARPLPGGADFYWSASSKTSGVA